MKRALTLLMIGLCAFALSADAVEPIFSAKKGKKRGPATTPPARHSEVEELTKNIEVFSVRMDQLEAEVELLKAQSKLLIQKGVVNFANLTYFKAGLSLLVPRARTFPFATDSGLGLAVGGGQYFGKNHVIDLAFEWDLFPSMVVRYRFEIHNSSPLVSFGPVVGYKIRAANMGPIDNFLGNPDEIKNSYVLFGGIFSFPLTRSLITLEFLFMTNQQSFMVANTAVHFLL